MYQSVLTNHPPTATQISAAYRKALNIIGDNVLNKQRYGIGGKTNRLLFIKLKNLLPVITADVVTIPYSCFQDVLKRN